MNEPMGKLDCIRLLYTASGFVKSCTAPDAAWAEQTGSSTSDIAQCFGPEYGMLTVVECAAEHPAAGAPAGEQGVQGAPAGEAAPATGDEPADNATPEETPASDSPASVPTPK